MVDEKLVGVRGQMIRQLSEADDVASEMIREAMVGQNSPFQYLGVHAAHYLVAKVHLLGLGRIQDGDHIVIVVETLLASVAPDGIKGEKVVSMLGVS